METSKQPKEILKEAREKKGFTQTQLAAAIGIGLRMYQKIEDGNFPKYKTEQVENLDKLLGTNLYKLIYDKKDEQYEPVRDFLTSRRLQKNTHVPFMVPFIPVKAQAGYVRAVDQELFLDALEKFQLPPGVNPQGAVWRYWEIEGESMEPEYRSGDMLLTSQVHHLDWENLRNFYAYVVVTTENVLFKRVFCMNDLEWVLISENEEQFPQQILPVEFVKEVWVVRRVIKNKLPPSKRFEITVKSNLK